jgi:hypothetical protein
VVCLDPIPALAAGARPKRQVGKDDDECEEHDPPDTHEVSARDGSRSFRLHAGDGSDGSNDDREDKPGEPGHGLPATKRGPLALSSALTAFEYA